MQLIAFPSADCTGDNKTSAYANFAMDSGESAVRSASLTRLCELLDVLHRVGCLVLSQNSCLGAVPLRRTLHQLPALVACSLMCEQGRPLARSC